MAATEVRDGVPEEEDAGRPVLRSAADAHSLLLDVVRRHADELLRVARAHSLCADDANDAYQRSLELFLRHGRRLRAETAHKWLFTVCKREAQAVARSRRELVAWDEVDFDRLEAGDATSPEERAMAGDVAARGTEALRGLKPAEVRALWLRASGRSYAEIQASTGWSYTKVNRSISEGRRAFLAQYARIEDGSECGRWAGVLSAVADGSAARSDTRGFRPHLRNCAGCQADLRRLRAGGPPAAIVWAPVLAGPASERGPGLPERIAHLGRWLGRLLEVATGPVQERAVTGAVKLQGALDAVSTGKLAVVATSAAALAGGGIVAEDSTRRAPVHRATAHAAAARHGVAHRGRTSASTVASAGRGTPAGGRPAGGGPGGPKGDRSSPRPAAPVADRSGGTRAGTGRSPTPTPDEFAAVTPTTGTAKRATAVARRSEFVAAARRSAHAAGPAEFPRPALGPSARAAVAAGSATPVPRRAAARPPARAPTQEFGP